MTDRAREILEEAKAKVPSISVWCVACGGYGHECEACAGKGKIARTDHATVSGVLAAKIADMELQQRLDAATAAKKIAYIERLVEASTTRLEALENNR